MSEDDEDDHDDHGSGSGSGIGKLGLVWRPSCAVLSAPLRITGLGMYQEHANLCMEHEMWHHVLLRCAIDRASEEGTD